MNSRSKKKLWTGLAICAALLILTAVLGRRFNFVRSPLYRIISPVTSVFGDFASWLDERAHGLDSREELLNRINSLERQVESLEQENRLLQSQNRRARELEELYDLSYDFRSYPQTAAEIIGLSPSNWYDFILIGKGSTDGIEEMMPVIAGGGLLGYVSTVYDTYSQVTTLVDSESLVFGQVNRPEGALVRVRGALSGYQASSRINNEEYLIVILDDDSSNICVGDEIVTSSLSDIYPAGLSIGTVIEISQSPSTGEFVAYLEPSAHISQLDLVSILTSLKTPYVPPAGEEETP